MRQIMEDRAWMLAIVICAGLAGCSCGKPKPVQAVGPVETPQAPLVAAETPRPPAERPAPEATPAPPPAASPTVAAQIEDLNQQYPDLFTFNKETGMLRFNADITFDSGSSVVKPRAKAALSKLAPILNSGQGKDRTLIIIGFTDNVRVGKASTIAHLKSLGKTTDNMGLSEARAEAVSAVLQANGIEANRMTTQGKGQAQPVASNKTAAGKAKNRRVEIYLAPIAAPK